MSNSYVIFTDASADVDVDFIKANGIKFVRMEYMVGDEEISCNMIESDETMKKFYDAQRDGKSTKTSQITPNTYIETFTPYLEKGISILYLSLSSGLTKTFDNVTMAAQMLAEDFDTEKAKLLPFDTLSATGGMGLLVERAVANQKAGMSIDENFEELTAIRQKIRLWFMVDDLMYLKRGGRIPATSAVLGTALNLKPILRVAPDGTLETMEKKRGVKMALKELAKQYEAEHDDSLGNRVYICHGDCSERADQLIEMIQKINPNADIHKMYICPVIGSHTGPGMLATLYYSKNR